MKKFTTTKTLAAIVLPFIFCIPTFAQSTKNIGEVCESDADCGSKYCVTVTVRNETKKICCNCDQNQLNGYTEKVTQYCKNQQGGMLAYADLKTEFGSKNELSLVMLNVRRTACADCLKARNDRESACFNGGDDEHKGEIQNMKDAIDYIDGIINEKKRNKLAYYCDDYTFENALEDVEDNCKDLNSLFEKYGIDNSNDVYCSDIANLVDKCIDCREAYEYLVNNCFRDGLSDERSKRFQEVKDMEKISKETYDKRRNENRCK
jgi:hypothetical protein